MIFSRIYRLELAYCLNVDFWCFLELHASKWLDYDLIMFFSMIICYDRDLVIFRDLLVCFQVNYVTYVDIMHMLWFFAFSVNYGFQNGMFMVWLRSHFNSGHFSILYTIFGDLCKEF